MVKTREWDELIPARTVHHIVILCSEEGCEVESPYMDASVRRWIDRPWYCAAHGGKYRNRGLDADMRGRNWLFFFLSLEGVTGPQLARRFGMSLSRIYGIVNRQRRMFRAITRFDDAPSERLEVCKYAYAYAQGHGIDLELWFFIALLKQRGIEVADG